MEERNERNLHEIVPRLLDWYHNHARILPWREDTAPYRIWVSEIMLQQTRVEAVKPYFTRFLEELPDIKSLANAPEDKLLKLWEGLGYYNRVRNMQKAAKVIMETYDGEMPASFEALNGLPGFGAYTAGAVASIAFDIRVPAVDGNVLRVITRVTGDTRDITTPAVKKEITAAVTDILPPQVGDFNQSLMELGALICQPNGAPKCIACPLHELCRAFHEGLTDQIPAKAKKKPRRIEHRNVFLILCGNKALIRKRPDSGILAGMWEFPNSEDEPAKALRKLGLEGADYAETVSAKHIFTHLEWRMKGFVVPIKTETEGIWVTAQELIQHPFPTALKKYYDHVLTLLQ